MHKSNKMHILFPITYQCNLDCAFCCSKALKKTAIDINKSVQAIKDNKSRIDWVYITEDEIGRASCRERV